MKNFLVVVGGVEASITAEASPEELAELRKKIQAFCAPQRKTFESLVNHPEFRGFFLTRDLTLIDYWKLLVTMFEEKELVMEPFRLIRAGRPEEKVHAPVRSDFS